MSYKTMRQTVGVGSRGACATEYSRSKFEWPASSQWVSERERETPLSVKVFEWMRVAPSISHRGAPAPNHVPRLWCHIDLGGAGQLPNRTRAEVNREGARGASQ
jgi:hypothetical protein